MASPVPTLVVNVPGTGETVVLHLTNAEHELPQHWQLGRASDCAVRISDPMISAHHLTIRAEPQTGGNDYNDDGTRRYIWMFRDSGSTNGTYQGGIQVGGRGEPCPWIEIQEGDIARVANTRIRFSFSGQFDEDTASGRDNCPTGTLVKPEINDLWDIVAIVLTGPATVSNWLWWISLAIGGSTLVLAIEWIRHGRGS
jgi:hypothetical protein